MERKRIRNALIQLVCTAAVFLLIVLFFHAERWIVFEGNVMEYTDDGPVEWMEPEDLGPVLFVCYVVAFFSFSGVALSFDLLLKPSFCTGTGSFGERAKKTVSSPLFWGELAAVLLLLFVLPDRFLLLAGNYRKAAYPTFALILFLSWTRAIGRWVNDERKRKIDREEGPKKYRANEVWLPIAFAVWLPFAVSVFAAPVVVIGSFLIVIFWRGFVVTASALVLLYSVIFLTQYLRAVSERKKMLKGLKRVCDDKGYTLVCESPYRSLLFPHPAPEITVKTGTETIECKLLFTQSKRTPIVLFQNGEATVIHGVRIGDRTVFRRFVNSRFEFGECDKKFLIQIPVTGEVCKENDVGFETFYPGDKFNGCTLYGASSFVDDLRTDDLD